MKPILKPILKPIVQSNDSTLTINNEFNKFQAQCHKLFHKILFEGARLPHSIALPLLFGHRSPTPPKILDQMREDLQNLVAQDIENVRSGAYPKALLKFPIASHVTTGLKWGPLDFLRIIQRSKARNFQELPQHALEGDYPSYYLRTFHWQTDGWFSEKSAQRYDASVEFLFGGAANMMRRMTLPPITALFQKKSVPQNGASGKTQMRILEIACGTGSFLQQIRAAYPYAALTGLDLSPDYINFARKNLPDPTIKLVAENAERMSFADETFDAVICINLFHELPPDARRNVFREARRVLKSGGVFSVSDSIQAADSDYLEGVMKRFSERFHEPFYPHYVKDDLAGIFIECGFSDVVSRPHLFSKAAYGFR